MKKSCAFAAVAALVSLCGAANAQITYSSTPNLFIADVATVSDTINVSGGTSNITGLTCRINLTHTWDADLDIALVSPSGAYILLTSDNQGSGDNYTNTVFEDTASASITTGVAPCTGSFQPEGILNGYAGTPNPPGAGTNHPNMAGFNGSDANGAWTLIISDDAGGDTGTLIDWDITVSGPTGVFAANCGQSTGVEGQNVAVRVVASPSIGNTISGVTVNASSLNPAASSVALADLGNNLWGANVLAAVPAGSYSFSYVATESTNATLSGSCNAVVSNSPSGGCCAGGNCSITREYLCGTSGGTFLGAGTDCGLGTYGSITSSESDFIDISTTGTLLTTASNVDDGGETINLPFSFNYQNTLYPTVWVCSNGFIQFGGGNSTVFTNVPIPNTAVPNNMIAPLWDDFDLVDTRNGPGLGAIYYLDDSAANNRAIISWQGVGQYNLATPPTDSNDFQVILYSNGNFEFRYGNVPTILTPQVPGDIVSIGYEDATGATGDSVDGPTVVAGGNTALTVAFIPASNPCGPSCDSIDFNGDTLFPDVQDITDFITVFGGGACPTGTCGDIDFNNDGLFPDTDDIGTLIRVFGGGSCTP